MAKLSQSWAVKLTQWLKVSWTSDENLRCEIITAQLLCAVSRQVTDKWRHNSWISSSFFLFASGMMCQNGLWKFPPPGRSFWITATSKHFCELIVCGSNIWTLQAFRDFYKGKRRFQIKHIFNGIIFIFFSTFSYWENSSTSLTMGIL